MNVTIFVNLNLKNISCTCIRLFGNPILRIMQSMLLIHLLGCGSDYVVSSVHTVTNVNSLFFVKNLIFFCALNKNWMTNRSNPMLESFSRVLLFLATFKEMPIFHLQWFTLRKKIVISLQEPSSYANFVFCFHYCLSFIWKKLSATWHVTLIQSKLTLKNDLISYSTEATLIICPPKQPQLVVPPWRKFPPPFRDTPCSFMCCLRRPFKGAFT